MRFPLETRQGNRIPFQNNIPGRTFRNPPHPETATLNSAKNRVAVSRPPDATLDKGDRFICAKERPQVPPSQ